MNFTLDEYEDGIIPDGLVIQNTNLHIHNTMGTANVYIYARADQDNINNWEITDYGLDPETQGLNVIIDDFGTGYARIGFFSGVLEIGVSNGFITLTATDDSNIETILHLDITIDYFIG